MIDGVRGAGLRSARGFGAVFTLLWTGVFAVARAEVPDPTPVAIDVERLPAISLIIDDLGNRPDRDLHAVNLPGPVACAFLPMGPHTRKLAQLAHSQNKEVMLHLPMQSVHDERVDAGALTLDMTETEFLRMLERDLEAVPHVTGINNHMGSLLTRHPGHMMWLMRFMQNGNGLFFVDSRTTDGTVARKVAVENGIPAIDRDVFLDNERDQENIARQFDLLVARAKAKGTAVGIGHPYPQTMAVLNREIRRLEEHGVRLVPVSRLIELKAQRQTTWRASLSH